MKRTGRERPGTLPSGRVGLKHAGPSAARRAVRRTLGTHARRRRTRQTPPAAASPSRARVAGSGTAAGPEIAATSFPFPPA